MLRYCTLHAGKATMSSPVVVVGIGELGAVFARGLLRTGHPVFPLTRAMDMAAEAEKIPEPELALIAVAENDLHSVLTDLPEVWRACTGLIQNELLPRDWMQHNLQDPTVISVWFEKKKGQDSKVLLPSPVLGPHATLLHEALGSIDIPVKCLNNRDELLYELVRKNVYILTTNIAGLVTGRNVADLWSEHRELARMVASEVIEIQEYLTDQSLDTKALIHGMVEAIDADPQHGCKGRTAPARLRRALQHADAAGLAVPTLREISQKSTS
jgi:hypothetical protein